MRKVNRSDSRWGRCLFDFSECSYGIVGFNGGFMVIFFVCMCVSNMVTADVILGCYLFYMRMSYT